MSSVLLYSPRKTRIDQEKYNSPSDQQKTLNVAIQLCDTVNVKSLPSAASCPASAGATAPVSSAASSGETGAASGPSAATTGVISGAQTASSGSALEASSGTTTSATGEWILFSFFTPSGLRCPGSNLANSLHECSFLALLAESRGQWPARALRLTKASGSLCVVNFHNVFVAF